MVASGPMQRRIHANAGLLARRLPLDLSMQLKQTITLTLILSRKGRGNRYDYASERIPSPLAGEGMVRGISGQENVP